MITTPETMEIAYGMVKFLLAPLVIIVPLMVFKNYLKW